MALCESFEDPYAVVSIAQVADCSSREFTDQKRLEMSMQEFIDRWVGHAHGASSAGDRGSSLSYLKDWHFVKVCP
jgi:AraC-like DNA-binding protein